MIRFTPKTKAGKGFDPVANALTAAAPIFRTAGCVKLVAECEGVTFDYPVDGTYARTSGPEIAERLSRQEGFAISVDGVTKAGSGHFTIRVINCLSTVPDLNVESGKDNFDFEGSAFAAPEAWTPAYSRSAAVREPSRSGHRECALRPFFGTLVAGVDGNIITCYGPSSRLINFYGDYFADVSVGGAKMPVFRDSDYQPLVIEDVRGEQPSESLSMGDTAGKVFVKSESGLTPVFLSQSLILIDGVALDYVSYLHCLKIAVFCEVSTKPGMQTYLGQFDDSLRVGDHWEIPLVSEKGRPYLAPEADAFYRRYCVGNTWLETLFSHLAATDTELVFENANNRGVISSVDKSASCFALSLAYLAALCVDGTLASTVAALDSAVAGGELLALADGTVVGNVAANGRTVSLRSWDGSEYSVRRDGLGEARGPGQRGSTYQSPSLAQILKRVPEGGCLILGFDADLGRKPNSRPDHYVVARRAGERFLCEFDPFGRGVGNVHLVRGADLTGYIDSARECAAVFLEKVVSDE